MSLISWDDVPEEKIREDISRKLITGERLMVAQIFLKKGCVVQSHNHESEQITYIVEGLAEFTLPTGKVNVGAGQVLVIPPNVPHGAVALEDTLDMDIFSPIRQDWLTGQDHYLREEG